MFFHQTIWVSPLLTGPICVSLGPLDTFFIFASKIYGVFLALHHFGLYSTSFLLTVLVDICKVLVMLKSAQTVFLLFLIGWQMGDVITRWCNLLSTWPLYSFTSFVSLKCLRMFAPHTQNILSSEQFALETFQLYGELRFHLAHSLS